MSRPMFGLFVVVLLSLCSPIYTEMSNAQEEKAAVNDISARSRLKALQSVALWDRPPRGGVLFRLGNQVGVVSGGEILKVATALQVRSPTVVQVWASIDREIEQLQPRNGWIYVGDLNAKSCCFALIK